MGSQHFLLLRGFLFEYIDKLLFYMFLKEWPPLKDMGNHLLSSFSRIFSLRKFLWKSVTVISGTSWLPLCRNSLRGLWQEDFLGSLSAVKKASMQWPFVVVESPGCLKPPGFHRWRWEERSKATGHPVAHSLSRRKTANRFLQGRTLSHTVFTSNGEITWF